MGKFAKPFCNQNIVIRKEIQLVKPLAALKYLIAAQRHYPSGEKLKLPYQILRK